MGLTFGSRPSPLIIPMATGPPSRLIGAPWGAGGISCLLILSGLPDEMPRGRGGLRWRQEENAFAAIALVDAAAGRRGVGRQFQ
jgi:hypothetical protein